MPLVGTHTPRRASYVAGAGFSGIAFDLVAGLVAGIAGLFVDSATRAASRVPEINLESRRIRAGRRSIAFSDISEARIANKNQTHSAAFELYLEGGAVTIALPVLKNGGVPRETSELLVTVLQDSTIAWPIDRHDPTGRFARYNFPMHVSKEVAIDLVERPPGYRRRTSDRAFVKHGASLEVERRGDRVAEVALLMLEQEADHVAQ